MGKNRVRGIALPILMAALAACGDSTEFSGLCSTESGTPVAFLGNGVGGAFVEYQDGQQVSLDVAPQGGFGVTVIVRTNGISAGGGQTADVQLDVEMDGQNVGTFLQENTALSCRGEETGGEVRGVVVGFDPQVYKTNDDLLTLNGEEVDLVVTVTNDADEAVTVRKSVTVVVGG